jgi:hypothetical protein
MPEADHAGRRPNFRPEANEPEKISLVRATLACTDALPASPAANIEHTEPTQP